MALNPHVSLARRNAALDSLTAQANSGIMRIYAASQPANADTAVGGQVLLAELTMGSPAFGAAAAGVATANAVTQDASANNNGTAAWFRLFASDGTTALIDGSCGTSAADCVLDSVAVTAGVPVTVTSFTISLAA